MGHSMAWPLPIQIIVSFFLFRLVSHLISVRDDVGEVGNGLKGVDINVKDLPATATASPSGPSTSGWALGWLQPAWCFGCAQLSTWVAGWMTKASGVGERRKGRGELRRDCHHRVAALFVPTRMQQWYIDIWYITMIYMGEGAGGGPFAGKITWCPWGAPEYVLKQEDSSELTLAFVIMTIIANNDKM